jgi:hypothetical protein
MYKQMLAQMTGNFDGQTTLEAKKAASQMDLQAAQAALARTNADKEFLLEQEKKKMEYAKQLQLQQQENEWTQMDRLLKARRERENGQGKGTVMPSGRFRWDGADAVPVTPSPQVPGVVVKP